MSIVAGHTDRACRDTDPEAFFPAKDSPDGEPPNEAERRALAICQGCPVRAACLEAALEFPAAEQWGVVGGMTAGDRRLALAADRRRPTRTYLDALVDLPVGPARSRPPITPTAAGGAVDPTPPREREQTVDSVVVAWLMAGVTVPEATRREAAEAAVALYQRGYAPHWIARQLREQERQTWRWVRRYEASEQLVRKPGCRPRDDGAAA